MAGVRGQNLPRLKNADEQRQLLQRIIEPFVLRRLKTDPNIAPDLPDKIERTVECELAEGQQALYKAVQEAEFAGLDNHADGTSIRFIAGYLVSW
jgi:SNF2 family DNA or RNA helicase